MPRPCKRRRICALPGFIRFGAMDVPARGKHLIHMTVDEYEAIRLIDLERLTQEACARRMGVARATVQAIYNRAGSSWPTAWWRGTSFPSAAEIMKYAPAPRRLRVFPLPKPSDPNKTGR